MPPHAPESPESFDRSYYAASARPGRRRPALAGEVRADVCVVGAGLTGLSTALELAERGYDVVLLEAERIGWGASGRNGGQICTGFSADPRRIAGWLGPDDARRLFALSEEAKTILRRRVERHAIDCDLRWGYFHAALKPRQLRALAETRAVWSDDYGYAGTALVEGRAAVADYVASEAYVGGLYESGAGQLHPLNYCLGLAEAAESAGARIFEGSRVRRLLHGGETGTEPAAETASGRVRARVLVVCANAYLDGLVPEIADRILAVGSYIGATEPLGAARARTLIPGEVAVADCNRLLNYYRCSADHRLLFGGRVGLAAPTAEALSAALKRRMAGVFPGLAEEPFAYLWGGRVALTRERTPDIGRLGPTLYYAQGYSGQGVALTAIAGRVLAEAIAGQLERFDLFARLPHRRFPGGRRLAGPGL
ncbi:MAG TPA: FAD-binding oxidoreductase, partial [Kiloniellales bacterium]|nr:FAD-binding oxidoreductase [Kiloniellales bacterium]